MLIFEIFYLISATLLALYGFNSLLLTWLYRRNEDQKDFVKPADVTGTNCPKVTVQLPVYNERHVVNRLIEAVVKLDWPAECLQVQILDDSTDDTRQIIATAVEEFRSRGFTGGLEHICRPDRRGYKAGALEHGLASATGEYVAIFDADFIPTPDFLQKTIPLFDEAAVGCVQSRWGHINASASPLTKAQALGIDGHFIIEQTARHRVRAFLNFNGTAGVWRRQCMIDAGGWEGDTLTEDLDLSYRAQLKGWRIVYTPNLVVPAELPVQIQAFKRQQFRWAKGSIQTACKLLMAMWRAPEPLWRKLLGTLHLTNYGVHPFMLLNLLTTLPMTLSDSIFLQLTPLFTLSAIGPPVLYWTAMGASGIPPSARWGRLGLLIALGTGLSLNNTRAVLEALFRVDSEFKRTPKFAVTNQFTTWQSSSYALPRDPMTWIELALGLYAFTLLGWVISQGIWWLILWLLLYGCGYIYVAGVAFVQAWQTRSAQAGAAA